MCGIAGIMDLNAAREIDRDALKRMTDALAHRGPDGEGYFYEDGLGLGHRRLAIIDPKGGHQPFISSSSTTVLNFNGEIYNFQTLKSTMKAAGLSFRTESDTEVLAELWDQKGPATLSDLGGMFALSIWDKNTRTLTLARDRLGEKPLYYAVTDDGFFVFASELPALLASGLVAKALSYPAISDYFAFGYIPDPKTIFRSVLKLPPGSLMILRQGCGNPAKPERYWQLSMQPNIERTYQDAIEQLPGLVDHAVQAQMVADVPLGAFLSGGVDSSAIVASMSLQTPERVHTTTIGFNTVSHDEREYAQQIATLYDTQHTEQLVDFDVNHLIPKIADIYGEPFADTSALPTYLVCQKTREQVSVALSGDGGDEIFAGYRRYPFFRQEQRIRSLLPGTIRRPLFTGLGSIYPALDRAPRPVRLKSTLLSLGQTAAAGYFRSVSINRPDAQQAMLSPEFRQALGSYQPQQIIADLFDEAGTNDPLLKAQYADLHTWLPGRMLVKVDRASMANSLEVRPPLLDHKLVEWAATLPPNFKLQGHSGKRVFKEAMHSRVPRDILYRKKQGFDMPVSAWLRQPDNNPLDLLRDTIHWKSCGILNETVIDAMMSKHRSGKKDYGQELWSIIMFNAFLATT